MTSIGVSRPVRLAAMVAAAAGLLAGAAIAPAYAQPRPDYHHQDVRRGPPPPPRDYHDWHHRDWGGPPVVYSPPAYGYAPPPVVYGGPSIGINLPGISIGID